MRVHFGIVLWFFADHFHASPGSDNDSPNCRNLFVLDLIVDDEGDDAVCNRPPEICRPDRTNSGTSS
jgi:hypothetical protein